MPVEPAKLVLSTVARVRVRPTIIRRQPSSSFHNQGRVYSHLLEKPARSDGLAAMPAAIHLVVQSQLAVVWAQVPGALPSCPAHLEICLNTIAPALDASVLGGVMPLEVARERTTVAQVSDTTLERILVAVVNPGLSAREAAGHGAGDRSQDNEGGRELHREERD
jgi:hypothetical protein